MLKTYYFLFKLLLIGDFGVDKTTVLRLFKDAFNTINILRNMQNNSMAAGIKPYSCPNGCELTFFSKFIMDRHVKRYHSGKPFRLPRKCHICGKIIQGRKEDLKRHVELHEIKERDHVCAVCGKGFTRERYLKQHSMSHGEFPHKCSYCGKRTFFELTTDIKRKKLKPLKYKRWRRNKAQVQKQPAVIKPTVKMEATAPQCRFCLRGITAKTIFRVQYKHEAKARDAFQIKPNDGYPFACANCFNMLDIFLDFKETVLKADKLLQSETWCLEDKGWNELDLIDALTKCRKAVKHHRKQVDKIYTKKFKLNKKVLGLTADENPGLLSSDLDELDQGLEKDENPNLFSNDEISEPVIEAHEQILDQNPNLHSSDLIPTEKVVQDSTLEVKPNMKVRKVTTKPKRIRRARKDNKASKVVCADDDSVSANDDDDGDDDFKPESDMEREGSNEANDSEEEEKPKPRKLSTKPQELCDLCGKRVCPQSVETHKNRHLGIKPYTCPNSCGLTFFSKFTMELHVKRLHSDKDYYKSRPCNICGKIIRGRTGDLKRHERLHEAKEKDHICTVCGKGFTRSGYLKQHSMTHGEFPHKCSYCGKRFNNKWSMKGHEKNMHEKRNSFQTVDEQPQMGVANEPEATGMALVFESFQQTT